MIKIDVIAMETLNNNPLHWKNSVIYNSVFND